MRCRLRTAVWALCAGSFAGTVVWWVGTGPLEPSYKGVELHDWVKQYADCLGDRDADPGPSIRALHAMEHESVPWFISRVGSDQLYWKFWAAQHWNKMPDWVQGNAPRPNLEPEEIHNAALGLSVIARDVPEAVPKLGNIVANCHKRESRKRALNVLFAFDENGVPVEKALPALLAMEGKGGPLIRNRGVEELTLNSNHDYVPALATCLRHRQRVVRVQALRLLGRFCAEGRCDPKVFKIALADPDPTVRQQSRSYYLKYGKRESHEVAKGHGMG